MDTVVFADKKYIKASKAATAAGYTADYVGQLCRKGKIDAVLLGKTWYVHEDSLASHKQQNADRSNAEVTRKDVQRQRAEIDVRQGAPIKTTSESAHWRRLLETPISYSSESDNLIPSPIRTSNQAPEKESDKGVEFSEPIVPEKEETPQNAEISVAIRRDVSDTSVKQKQSHDRVLREIRQVNEKNMEIQSLPEVREIVVRRSLAPMILATTMFIVLLLNIFAEIQWVYTSGGSQVDKQMDARYNVASLSSIMSDIDK
jgi:hypothetical protein